MEEVMAKFTPRNTHYKSKSPNVTLRCDPEMFDKVGDAAEKAGCSKSEFVRQAMEYALDNMK